MFRYAVSVLFMILCASVYSQGRWYADFTPGWSTVSPVPLWINQEGGEPIRIWAGYESAPLRRPYYYSVRLGTENAAGGWEVELNHLKVYLRNRPPEIDRFSISHGYNQLLVNRSGHAGRLNTKAGLGLVLAHPENTVRGMKLDEGLGLFGKGYYIAGPVAQHGIYKKFRILNSLYFLLEARVSAAYASVPVANGKAGAPVVALHLQAGPGLIAGH